MNEVIALTRMNGGLAIVLKDKVNFKYEKHGDIIIGLDDTETFVDCLYYERPIGRFKAFGGREFDINLINGEIIKCNGQWWHGGIKKVSEILNDELISVTMKDIESLEECYVYSGCYGIKRKVDEMINNYNGKIFDYYEFESSYWNKVHYEEIKEGKSGRYKISGMRKVKNPDFVNVV